MMIARNEWHLHPWSPPVQLSSKTYDIDDFAAAQELFHANGWTDGLPVMLPTRPVWNGRAWRQDS
jgi:hypothetical protein